MEGLVLVELEAQELLLLVTLVLTQPQVLRQVLPQLLCLVDFAFINGLLLAPLLSKA